MLISKKLLRLQYFDILFSSSEDDVFEIKARYFFSDEKSNDVGIYDNDVLR